MDATAFVSTALRRKTVEVSLSKLTEGEATEMDKAKSRVLAEWIQEEEISKVRERQDVPESRLMSMHWVPTWKPSDEHTQSRKCGSQSRDLGVSASRGRRVESMKSDAVETWNDAHDSVDSIQPGRVGMRSRQARVSAGRWTRCARHRKLYSHEHLTKTRVP